MIKTVIPITGVWAGWLLVAYAISTHKQEFLIGGGAIMLIFVFVLGYQLGKEHE